MRELQLIEYYVKGLDADVQRGMIAKLKRDFNFLQEKCVNDMDNSYANILQTGVFKSIEDIEQFLSQGIASLNALNNAMIESNREPLFNDVNNLKECLERVKMLKEYRPESEWNKILKCKSFESYKPKVLKKEIESEIEK